MHNWKGLIYTNEIKMCTSKMFEDIKHVDESGNEYWYARELVPYLQYSKWENFYKVIQKAIVASKKVTIIHFGFLKSGGQSKLVKGKKNLLKTINYLGMHVI